MRRLDDLQVARSKRLALLDLRLVGLARHEAHPFLGLLQVVFQRVILGAQADESDQPRLSISDDLAVFRFRGAASLGGSRIVDGGRFECVSDAEVVVSRGLRLLCSGFSFLDVLWSLRSLR